MRSASPSVASPASHFSLTTVSCSRAMCGSMGSGLIPGNSGFTSCRIAMNGTPRSLKNSGKNSPAGTVHRVDRELELGFADQIHVGKTANRGDVGRLEVDFFDGRFRTLRHRTSAQLFFDSLHDGGRGGAAKLSFELHSVPVPRIVAGGDHHSARSALVFHRIGHGRGGRVIVGQLHRNACGGNHLRSHLRRALRGEARVIADDYSALRVLVFQYVGSDRARDPAHVVEREVVGDDAAPAVGSEFDFLSHGSQCQ